MREYRCQACGNKVLVKTPPPPDDLRCGNGCLNALEAPVVLCYVNIPTVEESLL